MDISEDPLFKTFVQNRELKETTIRRYSDHIKLYCTLINKTPTELIEEAEKEEDKGIRLRSRKLKGYLLNFKDYLNKKDYSPHTRSSALVTVRSLYTEYDIELPRMKFKIKFPEEDISTIPSKDDIRSALKIANTKYKAIILLGSSGGLRASEIRGLKYSDLLNSLNDYINTPLTDPLNVGELTNIVQRNELTIPTWKFTSEKTGTNTITFSTPECLEAILTYLKTEPPLTLDEPLFHSNLYKDKPISRRGFTQYFSKIDRNCAFKKHGRLAHFRSHNLRKYFASTLETKISKLRIDWMMGHKINRQDSSYFKLNIESLKESYINCIDDLSITKTKTQTLQSPEFSELKLELKKQKEVSDDIQTKYNKLMQILEDEGKLDKLD